MCEHNKRIGNKHRIKYFIVFHLTKYTGCRLEMKLLLEDSLNHLTWKKKKEVLHHLQMLWCRSMHCCLIQKAVLKTFSCPFFCEFLLRELLILNKWPYKRKRKCQWSLKCTLSTQCVSRWIYSILNLTFRSDPGWKNSQNFGMTAWFQ